ARGEPARASGDPVADRLRQLDHLDGACPVGQAADEAAFLERRDETVDARLGTQIKRILHFVERGRDTGFLEPLVDETQELELFASQHRICLPRRLVSLAMVRSVKTTSETKHERTLSVRYVFRNPLI